MKLERATTVDIVFSVLLPPYGIILGLTALAKRETRRAKTILSVASFSLILAIIVIFSRAYGP